MYVIRDRDKDYPSLLKDIPQRPKKLYVAGELLRKTTGNESLMLAIVGSRRATKYGLDMAFVIAKELSEFGLTIVSGLAEGIDAAAHRGALAGNGGTIAVLGCGLDVYYPWINRKLQDEIAAAGSLVTEFPAGTKPRGDQFPSRNRIISGLSVGVLVVEGASRSGTLITADMALAQGREVFAIPGSVNSRYSKTPHKLLKAGACLVESADDILNELDMSIHVGQKKRPAENDKRSISLSEEEKRIISIVMDTPKKIDEIIYETRLQCEKVSSILVLLEIRKQVSRTIDGAYLAC